jgi:hypothetical protein
MLARIRDTLISPAAGPIASALALLLAVLLAVTMIVAHRNEVELDARVAKLASQLNDSGSYWRARAVACEAVGQRRQPGVQQAKGDGKDQDAAARLASDPPAGFDVCARMESADAAVLSTLK